MAGIWHPTKARYKIHRRVLDRKSIRYVKPPTGILDCPPEILQNIVRRLLPRKTLEILILIDPYEFSPPRITFDGRAKLPGRDLSTVCSVFNDQVSKAMSDVKVVCKLFIDPAYQAPLPPTPRAPKWDKSPVSRCTDWTFNIDVSQCTSREAYAGLALIIDIFSKHLTNKCKLAIYLTIGDKQTTPGLGPSLPFMLQFEETLNNLKARLPRFITLDQPIGNERRTRTKWRLRSRIT